ncbi:MAG: Zn-dependent hydrolase [Alphaproteobacteria bacterium]
MFKANPERALADLYELRKFGKYKTGVHRPTLSPQDMQAREWLADKLRQIGHEVTIDGVANVFGRTPAKGPVVLCGSHVESQNHAGWLDGALGVVYALEAARAAAEAGVDGGVDVIGFADEEGHFTGASFIGSQSFVGDVTEDQLDGSYCRSGRGTLREMLDKAGLAGRPRLTIEPSRYRAFFEAHIEQGQTLESQDLKIGVVSSIVAIWKYRITFAGVQNHAGTTTMDIRKDAGKALMQFWHKLEQAFAHVASPDSVWTVGRVSLSPGDPSIIPGGAEMLFQFRDADPEILNRMKAQLVELVAEANQDALCPCELHVMSESTPAHMAEAPKTALIDAGKALTPDQWLVMPSRAGHDAQLIAPHVPTAMMFVPSIGGISHHWTENTSDEDLMIGAQVYTDAVARMLA